MTNVLSHDQHYRHVARLWNSWLDTRQVNKLDPEQVFLRNKKLANAYSQYCSDLVRRTLSELGFNESTSNYFVRNSLHKIHFKVTDSSEILLESENQRLCFIPCFTNNLIQHDSVVGGNNQRILLSLYRGNQKSHNNLCSSPTNFYSLEQLALWISKWLVSQTYSSLGTIIPKIPQPLVQMLRSINADGYWKIENNNVTTIKPCLKAKPRLLEFKQRNNEDISICQTIDTIIKLSEEFEELLYCPCCCAKADESQWVSRDNNCFSIRKTSCNLSWEVNRQSNGCRVLVINPVKLTECNSPIKQTFEKYGRYKMEVYL